MTSFTPGDTPSSVSVQPDNTDAGYEPLHLITEDGFEFLDESGGAVVLNDLPPAITNGDIAANTSYSVGDMI